MQRKPLLKGWKLYVTAGTLGYALMLVLLWLRRISRHPDRSVFGGLSEIAGFAAIVTACLVVLLAYDQRKRGK